MRIPFRSFSRSSSKTNSVTMLVLGMVLIVLGVCGLWYWQYVGTQTVLLQERNFRALTVTSHALREMVTNYESVFKSVIEGEPCTRSFCPERDRRKAYQKALLELQAFQDVKVIKEAYENDGFAVKFIYHNGKFSIKLTYVHQDRAWPIQTRWKVTAVSDIGPIMRQLVTEDIFSDALLADSKGRVLYHHQSAHDPSGFEFEDVSAFLHRVNDTESKNVGADKGEAERKEDLVSKLPLFNEAPIGGISHVIFAQATDLPADRETAHTVILVGIVPAGQFYAEARAIALNMLLVMVGLMLAIFFVLPYLKLRTNAPTERLTSSSVAVLIVSSLLGTALLTFGLADIATYRNLEQHLDTRLIAVSDEIKERFNDDVKRGLDQLAMFVQTCRNNECVSNPKARGPYYYDHLAQRLCVGADKEKGFFFFPTKSDDCSENNNKNHLVQIVYRDIESMFWVGSTGEFRVFQSRDSHPWKYVDLNMREYVRRIWEDETFTRGHDGSKFWIQPIYSLTTGFNSAVLSMKSGAHSSTEQHPDRPTVAALEVKLPSVTNVGVPPGMGFAVIDQQGKVLFHSDARRNLRENLFEETDRDGRLRQAVFARATDQFDGRYWGKDRHFHSTPLFSTTISESPDVHWSLVTYWNLDMLRDLNLRALYSSGALFFIYGIIALSISVTGWWLSSRASEATYRWVWPQSEHLHRYQIAIWLLLVSLVAAGIWYLRPHPAPDMLVWVLLPALASAGLVLSIAQSKADPTVQSRTDASAGPSYRRSYALVVTLILLTFVVIPALVIFRVAINEEWRLLAKFSLYDLEQDRDLQAQKIRQSYPSALFHDPRNKGEVRNGFLQKFSDQNVMYADFPFESCEKIKKESKASEHCREVSTSVVQRGDERLIQWLYQVIERPRIGRSRAESDTFLEVPMRLELHEPWFGSGLGTLRFGDRSHAIPSPIPEWLYSVLILGSLLPLAVLRLKKVYAFAAVMCVLAGFLSFGLFGQALVVLWVSVLLYGTFHALPRFAAQRVLLLDFPYPSMGLTATNTGKGSGSAGRVEDPKPPDGWPPDLWKVFVKEMSALPDALCLADEPTFCEKISKQSIKEDVDIVKERIIQEILARVTEYYMQIWKNCTESQRRSLFNLARDRFLHSRNPNIEPLLKSGLIIADLNLRVMNESFRRFVIRTGLKERLDEDIAQERADPWSQVVRPIGAGLLLVMIFLVMTQEQYRTVTGAFLTVLPGLLAALSQILPASKKEKPETASSA